MITNKIIREEVDELKTLMSQEELNIPSFWSCIWPGFVCMIWFLLSSYMSYGISEFSTSMDRSASMVFAGVMGVFSIIVIANTRAIFLSVPESFRKKSVFFRLLSKKCKCYGMVILITFTCSSFYFSKNHIFALEFMISTGFCFLLTIIIMNVDLGRYQLATLTSVIETFKKSKNNQV